MPGAVAASFVAAGLGETAAAVAAYALTGLASMVASAAMKSFSEPSRPRFNINEDPTRGIRLNTRSTSQLYPLIYGTMKVGGNDVFIEAAGSNNNELWIVQVLGEGECDSIYQDGGVDQVYLGDRLYSEYGGNVSYWFHSGSNTQAVDPNLNNAIPKWTDCLINTCYIVWKLTYDPNYFQNLPERLVILKGLRLYDFRDGSTAWSDNPVLCLYDYMTNSRYGEGIDPGQIDTTTWTAAANYCDTKGISCNMVINQRQNADAIRDDILASFRGHLNKYDGKYYLRYSDLNYESSVMTLTDNHIVQGQDGKAQISIQQPSKFDSPDGIKVSFLNGDKNWTEDSIVIGESNNTTEEVRLACVTDRATAANIATYLLERKQLNRTITGTFRDDAIQLEPHDIVTFNSSALNISDQIMRVKEVTYRSGGLVDLTLMYESTSLYDDDYDSVTEGAYTCNLPDPTDEPPSVSNVTQSEETYYYRLRSFTRWKINFDEPANYPWFDHVEVWQSFDDVTYKHLFDVNDDFIIDPVEEGTTYYLKLRTVSIWGTKQDMTNAYKISRTIQGKTSAPSSLSALHAIVNANTINLYADKVSDPDVELYEFRLGSAWSSGIFLAALRAPNLSLYGVKPGDHTFFCNTLSNNGQYGDTPRQASASLKDPPDGWTVQDTKTDNYSGGTHDNTEQTTYNSEYYLKCSHIGGVLTGTYTSPIFDLLASGRYMVYVLADIVVTGAGTTWDDVIPAGTTWDEIEISTRTWNEIFELSAGPQVKIKLKYGETSPPTNEVEKMEILSAIVTGRYFQVEIEITDPSDAVNALVEHFTLKFCQ